MSQSPEDLANREQVTRYAGGWEALNTLIARGASFSGNERNCVFLNCSVSAGTAPASEVRFANISAVSGFDYPDDARGIAAVDWDQDGDLDLWVNNRTSPRLRLLLNQSTHSANSVALYLEGVDCNRDAIGARVEIRLDGAAPVVRSVRAGEGYLSQSSRWLHFGLGPDAAIRDVTVTWPGGNTEVIANISRGGRYLIRQGTGAATPWSRQAAPAAAPPALVTSPNPGLPSRSVAQVLLPRRVPAPQLVYQATGSTTPAKVSAGDTPLLILLYSSSCPHCQTEIARIAASETELRNGGLDLLALSVDHLADSSPGGPVASDSAVPLAERGDFPFRSGRATPTLLAKLKTLESTLFEVEIPFAVPAGYLLDSQQNLVALYRGPVPRKTLLHDVRLAASADENQMRNEAAPFAGRWYTLHPGLPALLELLADDFQGQFPEESARYLELSLPELDGAGRMQVHRRIAGTRHGLGMRAMASNHLSEAESQFRAAVSHLPGFARGHHDLGVVLFQQGKLREAEAAFLHTLKLSPSHAGATKNLETVRRAILRQEAGNQKAPK